MTRHYYIDRETKQIFVYDTVQDSIDHEYLGQSDHSNHKVGASLLTRGLVGFRILLM